MSGDRKSWRARLGPTGTLALTCGLICIWSLVLISVNENLLESRILIGLTVLGALAAGSAWLSVKWRKAEQQERQRRRQPFSLN
jgi:hypothetical protein